MFVTQRCANRRCGKLFTFPAGKGVPEAAYCASCAREADRRIQKRLLQMTGRAEGGFASERGYVPPEEDR